VHVVRNYMNFITC